MSIDDVPLSVFGVGLAEDGVICVNACVNRVGYGFSDDDFPQEWVSITELKASCYPYLYMFIAKRIGKTISQEEADSIATRYWG